MREALARKLSDCDECMAARCTVCGHAPCPICVDCCDHPECIEWDDEGEGQKKHVCQFTRCPKHRALPTS